MKISLKNLLSFRKKRLETIFYHQKKKSLLSKFIFRAKFKLKSNHKKFLTHLK
jgi:hypothetical protein